MYTPTNSNQHANQAFESIQRIWFHDELKLKRTFATIEQVIIGSSNTEGYDYSCRAIDIARLCYNLGIEIRLHIIVHKCFVITLFKNDDDVT